MVAAQFLLTVLEQLENTETLKLNWKLFSIHYFYFQF